MMKNMCGIGDKFMCPDGTNLFGVADNPGINTGIIIKIPTGFRQVIIMR